MQLQAEVVVNVIKWVLFFFFLQVWNSYEISIFFPHFLIGCVTAGEIYGFFGELI